MKRLVACLIFAAFVAPSFARAANPDARLATVRKAFVVAVDELANDDKLVASCLAGHLNESTPIEVVKSKDEADVIFRIGSSSKKATITAYLPDGASKLWSGETDLKSGFGLVMVKHDACGLAENLTDKLREAMRKARGK